MDGATSIDNQICDLRRTSMACREIAETVGVSEYYVWNVLRKRGLAGKYRANGRKGKRSPWSYVSVAGAVDQYGSIEIESGLNGGYIATIGEATGEEKEGVTAAVRDAVRVVMS